VHLQVHRRCVPLLLREGQVYRARGSCCCQGGAELSQSLQLQADSICRRDVPNPHTPTHTAYMYQQAPVPFGCRQQVSKGSPGIGGPQGGVAKFGVLCCDRRCLILVGPALTAVKGGAGGVPPNPRPTGIDSRQQASHNPSG
jgi:hypothetical protein